MITSRPNFAHRQRREHEHKGICWQTIADLRPGENMQYVIDDDNPEQEPTRSNLQIGGGPTAVALPKAPLDNRLYALLQKKSHANQNKWQGQAKAEQAGRICKQ